MAGLAGRYVLIDQSLGVLGDGVFQQFALDRVEGSVEVDGAEQVTLKVDLPAGLGPQELLEVFIHISMSVPLGQIGRELLRRAPGRQLREIRFGRCDLASISSAAEAEHQIDMGQGDRPV